MLEVALNQAHLKAGLFRIQARFRRVPPSLGFYS